MRFLTQLLITSIAAMVVFDISPRRLVAGDADAVARTVGSESNNSDDRTETRQAQIVRAKNVIDASVFNAAGRRLGQIDALVVDVRNGDIRYAALEFPTLFGRDKLFAIPWGSLNPRRTENDETSFQLDVSVKKLRMAPGFDRQHWPDVGNRRFAERIDVYYGVVIKEGDLKSNFGTDVGRLGKVPHLLRSQKLAGTSLQGLPDTQTGRIEEVLIDLDRGVLRYAVAAPVDTTENDHLRYPIPWSRLEVAFETEKASPKFRLEKEKSDTPPPNFPQDRWPSLRDPEWSQAIDRYYGVKPGANEPPIRRRLR